MNRYSLFFLIDLPYVCNIKLQVSPPKKKRCIFTEISSKIHCFQIFPYVTYTFFPLCATVSSYNVYCYSFITWRNWFIGIPISRLIICSKARPSAASNESLMDFSVSHSFKNLTKLIRFSVTPVTGIWLCRTFPEMSLFNKIYTTHIAK